MPGGQSIPSPARCSIPGSRLLRSAFLRRSMRGLGNFLCSSQEDRYIIACMYYLYFLFSCALLICFGRSRVVLQWRWGAFFRVPFHLVGDIVAYYHRLFPRRCYEDNPPRNSLPAGAGGRRLSLFRSFLNPHPVLERTRTTSYLITTNRIS